jgi:hypothetical protein
MSGKASWRISWTESRSTGSIFAADGQITLTAEIDEITHHDTFGLRVVREDRSGQGEVATVDPDSRVGKMLAYLGYRTRASKGADRAGVHALACLVRRAWPA